MNESSNQNNIPFSNDQQIDNKPFNNNNEPKTINPKLFIIIAVALVVLIAGYFILTTVIFKESGSKSEEFDIKETVIFLISHKFGCNTVERSRFSTMHLLWRFNCQIPIYNQSDIVFTQ